MMFIKRHKRITLFLADDMPVEKAKLSAVIESGILADAEV